MLRSHDVRNPLRIQSAECPLYRPKGDYTRDLRPPKRGSGLSLHGSTPEPLMSALGHFRPGRDQRQVLSCRLCPRKQKSTRGRHRGSLKTTNGHLPVFLALRRNLRTLSLAVAKLVDLGTAQDFIFEEAGGDALDCIPVFYNKLGRGPNSELRKRTQILYSLARDGAVSSPSRVAPGGVVVPSN